MKGLLLIVLLVFLGWLLWPGSTPTPASRAHSTAGEAPLSPEQVAENIAANEAAMAEVAERQAREAAEAAATAPLMPLSGRIRVNSAGTPELTIRVRSRDRRTIDAFRFSAEVFDNFGDPAMTTRPSRLRPATNVILLQNQADRRSDRVSPRGTKTLGHWSLFHNESARKARITITSVHFTNGETWTGSVTQELNPLAPE